MSASSMTAVPPPSSTSIAIYDNLVALRVGTWPSLDCLLRYQRLMADDFEGVQLPTDDRLVAVARHCGLDRINRSAETDAVVAEQAARGIPA